MKPAVVRIALGIKRAESFFLASSDGPHTSSMYVIEYSALAIAQPLGRL